MLRAMLRLGTLLMEIAKTMNRCLRHTGAGSDYAPETSLEKL